MNRKTILVLAASHYQVETIRRAKQLGYRVVTTDNVSGNPGHLLADSSYDIDTTDRDAVLEIARYEQVDGIIAPATDVAVPTMAHVAELLGLPGPPLESAEILCDKLKFRSFQKHNGFPVPEMISVNARKKPDPAFFDTGRFILKPDRSSGCKGAFIVASHEEYMRSIPKTISFSPTGNAVLERFIEGFQGTLEGIIKNGEPVLTFFLDRQTFSPPYVTTCGHHVPTYLPYRTQQNVLKQLGKICRLLRLNDGPFDCDFIATDDEVFILEMAPRVGGNSIARLVRHSTNFDLIEYSIRDACGDRAELPVSLDFAPTAIILLGVYEKGTLFYDKAQAKALISESWVHALTFDFEIGDQIQPFKNGRHRVGEALVYGRNRSDLDMRVLELKRRLALGAIVRR